MNLARDTRRASVRYVLDGRRRFHNLGYLVNSVRAAEKAQARGATDIEIRIHGGDWKPWTEYRD